ncbi:MAG: capsid cement protein [Acidimicrobiia bacterium]
MAVSGGIVERYGKPAGVTMTTSAAVTEGRLVEYTGNQRVAHAAAGSLKVAGVAAQTCSAAEDQVTVFHEGIFDLEATGAIAVGDYLEAAANGTVRPLSVVDVAGSLSPKAIVGKALAAIANGAKGPVKLLT